MKHFKPGALIQLIKVGSLVRVKPKLSIMSEQLGIVTDVMEMNDGFDSYEVVFPGDRGWFSDLDLELVEKRV